MSAFNYGTTNEALLHELSRDQSKTTEDLVDITTKFIDGEDAVRAIFAWENPHAMQASQAAQRKSTESTMRSVERATMPDMMDMSSAPQIAQLSNR